MVKDQSSFWGHVLWLQAPFSAFVAMAKHKLKFEQVTEIQDIKLLYDVFQGMLFFVRK